MGQFKFSTVVKVQNPNKGGQMVFLNSTTYIFCFTAWFETSTSLLGQARPRGSEEAFTNELWLRLARC